MGTDPKVIAAGLTPKMRQALIELEPTMERQSQPTHKGNASASLCYIAERTIGQDCYARLGKDGAEVNKGRQSQSDPLWIKTWTFTKMGLAVRAHLLEQPSHDK